ncbi:hypothetical protein EVAR_15113_1 [Eumeta japonica]|uniref:Uncharacterized protein n=1 Tax=Eumeta variegata TaxID=151549 RepID=A0A4C1UIW2_EUMVA|nr:hypothetical protein EVAR_15113_1 [Eumeta japonica]
MVELRNEPIGAGDEIARSSRPCIAHAACTISKGDQETIKENVSEETQSGNVRTELSGLFRTNEVLGNTP